MWKIENPEIKAKVNQFFSDEEIDVDCLFQMENESEFIDLLLGEGEIQIRLQKNYFKKEVEYKPDDWNPYPEVKPPANGRYLVTRQMKIDNGDTAIFIQLAGFENGQWFMKNDVIAFRELPKPYDPTEENE